MGKASRKKQIANETVAPARPWFPPDWILGLLLIVGALLAYLPVWHAGYVWDDDNHLTQNPCIVGPLGFREIWTTAYADVSPLTRSTFWLEHKLWGLAPMPYHVVNVLLHAACAIVLWRVLRALLIPGAWLGAALWELHPVSAESVAWVSEMKNTESGLFFLLSIFFFVKWVRQSFETPRSFNRAYVLTLVFAALAMACKSSTVVLPAVFVLCAWWIEKKWHGRSLGAVVPTLFMTLASSALTIGTQHAALATDIGTQWVRAWPERIAAAGDAVWFYLFKLLWPHPLMAVYPRWQIDDRQAASYLATFAVIAALFVFWLYRKSWARPWFFCFAFFLLAILPVLGLIDGTIFRYSLVFDHFQYLASMAPLALVAAGLRRGAELVPAKPWSTSPLIGCLLLFLGAATHQRASVYESDETLWTDTLAENPHCWVAHYNLANDVAQSGQDEEAVSQYKAALTLYPQNAEAHNNLANTLLRQGLANEALDQFQQAIRINPAYADAHYNFGNALVKNGRVDDGMAEFQKALESNPSLTQARNGLGNALIQKGRIDEAIAQFQGLVYAAPKSAEAHLSLGNAYFIKRQPDDAIAQYQRALEIRPDFASAHNNLGLALAQKGQIADAISQFQEALRIDPNYADARDNLNQAQAQQPQTPFTK